MRTFLITAAVAGLVATSAFAAQQHSATGTIKDIDSKAMTLTLADGSVYALPHKFKTADLKAGEKVSVAWAQNGTKKMAETVKPLK